jgi:hypothetical protein
MRPVSKADKARKPDRIAKQEEADFASAVIEVYRARFNDTTIDPRLASVNKEQWSDVCRVGFGLAAIRQAIDQRFKTMDPEEMQEGPREALAIVDALTSGRAHPIWSFLEGMRTSAHRAGRMRPNNMELMGQDWVLGTVSALKQAGCKHPKRAVVDVCADVGVTLDQQQIRDWERARRKSDDPEAPNRIAGEILNHAQNKMSDELSLADRILKAVRLQTRMLLHQPELKTGK